MRLPDIFSFKAPEGPSQTLYSFVNFDAESGKAAMQKNWLITCYIYNSNIHNIIVCFCLK